MATTPYSERWHIYVLRLPSGEPVYVGCTMFPKARLSVHNSPNHKGAMGSDAALLRARGERLSMEILEVVTHGRSKREAHWIRHFLAQGADLRNRRRPS